jgi:hypothetical protein
MTTSMKILTGAICAAALIGLGFVPLIHDPRPEIAAHAETERITLQMEAESSERLHRAKVRHAYIDSDAVGDLYAHCTGFEPPKQPANQKRCQAVIDRVEKEIAAADAARAKAEAKW